MLGRNSAYQSRYHCMRAAFLTRDHVEKCSLVVRERHGRPSLQASKCAWVSSVYSKAEHFSRPTFSLVQIRWIWKRVAVLGRGPAYVEPM